ncbi:hypothetical protein [Sphingomonas sp.]|uniref:hypothetical protein n=1 Tax=Sphingomonas sp. TaxID=28214 RepID=UPI002DD69D7D|nr:hypothetical protein [Sphingomonas sp.]
MRGNYEGAVKFGDGQDDARLTQDLDRPGLLDGANGAPANQRAHAFELFGTAEVFDGFRVGANMLFDSAHAGRCQLPFKARLQRVRRECGRQPEHGLRPAARLPDAALRAVHDRPALR